MKSDSVLDADVSIQIKRENSQERDARLHNEAEDAKFKRWKDFGFSIITATGSICAVVFCLGQIADPAVSPENKAQAWSLITLVIGGYLGFITGKGTK